MVNVALNSLLKRAKETQFHFFWSRILSWIFRSVFDINIFKVKLDKTLKPVQRDISAIKVINFLDIFFQSKRISYLGNFLLGISHYHVGYLVFQNGLTFYIKCDWRHFIGIAYLRYQFVIRCKETSTLLLQKL